MAFPELQTPSPNPTRGIVTLRYVVPEGTEMRLAIYDVLGREVQALASGLGRGRVQTQLDMKGLGSGLYLLRLEVAGQAVIRPMTVVR